VKIKIEVHEFTAAQSKQQSDIDKLTELYSEQKAAFDGLAGSWIGSGGDSFKECAHKMLDQTLKSMGILDTLMDQTKTAQSALEETDRKLAM